MKGIFTTPEAAIFAANQSLKELSCKSQSEINLYIKSIRKFLLDNDRIKTLSQMAVEETGMGRAEHKIAKNTLAITKTPTNKTTDQHSYVGDLGITLEGKKPYGIIGAITPITNPSETIICNTIGMLSSGNTVVFCPHPNAKKVSFQAIAWLNEALVQSGAPENLVTTYEEITMENTDYIISNPSISMLVATGGPAIVNKVLKSGKKAIGASAGNPPVVVDETADLNKAARDIINGASLDNNLPCLAEKELIAVESIADQLIFNMTNEGAYLLRDKKLIEQLTKIAITEEGKINTKFVGKSASVFLTELGIEVDYDCLLIIFECDKSHPIVTTELLMPILPIVRAKDISEAIDIAFKSEGGNFHTSVIHSKNIDNINRMFTKMNTTIFVQNAPSYAGIGLGSEGYASFTIAGVTGEGLTNSTSFAKKNHKVLVESFA